MSAFLERMNAIGTNNERINRAAQNSFDRYFNSFRKNKAKVHYPNDYIGEKPEEWEFIMQDRNVSNNEGWADEKLVILPYDTPVSKGVIFFWSNTWWLVFDREYRSLQTHQQLRARAINFRLNWRVNDRPAMWPDGEMGQPVLVQNATRHNAGVSRTGVTGRFADSSATLYFQKNEDSETIKRGDRIAVGNQVFRVMTLDKISTNGVITAICEEHFVNHMTDDMEVGIANAEDYFPPVEVIEAILGPKFVKPNESIIFDFNEEYAEVYGELIEWEVINGDDLVTIMSSSGVSLNLIIKPSMRNVGKRFTIKAKTKKATSELEVTIISPF